MSGQGGTVALVIGATADSQARFMTNTARRVYDALVALGIRTKPLWECSSAAEVAAGLQGFLKTSGGADSVLVYIHSHADPDSAMATELVFYFGGERYTLSELLAAASGRGRREISLIVDACRAGCAPHLLGNYEGAVTMLLSCGSEELSYEHEASKQSLFSLLFVRALHAEHECSGGEIRLGPLCDRILKAPEYGACLDEIRKTRNDNTLTQTPEFHPASGRDTVLIRIPPRMSEPVHREKGAFAREILDAMLKTEASVPNLPAAGEIISAYLLSGGDPELCRRLVASHPGSSPSVLESILDHEGSRGWDRLCRSCWALASLLKHRAKVGTADEVFGKLRALARSDDFPHVHKRSVLEWHHASRAIHDGPLEMVFQLAVLPAQSVARRGFGVWCGLCLGREIETILHPGGIWLASVDPGDCRQLQPFLRRALDWLDAVLPARERTRNQHRFDFFLADSQAHWRVESMPWKNLEGSRTPALPFGKNYRHRLRLRDRHPDDHGGSIDLWTQRSEEAGSRQRSQMEFKALIYSPQTKDPKPADLGEFEGDLFERPFVLFPGLLDCARVDGWATDHGGFNEAGVFEKLRDAGCVGAVWLREGANVPAADQEAIAKTLLEHPPDAWPEILRSNRHKAAWRHLACVLDPLDDGPRPAHDLLDKDFRKEVQNRL